MFNMNSSESMQSQDILSHQERQELLRHAKDVAKSRLSPEQRQQVLKSIKASQLEDKARAEAISAMIAEHASKDVFPKMALRGEDFAQTQEPAIPKIKARQSEDVTEALEILKDPNRAKQIYEEQKLREEVDKAIENIREDKAA